MGWIWRDDDDDQDNNLNSLAVPDIKNPSNGDYCSTRRTVKSSCRTEEVESGKFIRKCEKTEELLKDCLGKPTEVLQSVTEYTEEDVTDEVMRGSSIKGQSEIQPFEFPGLRNDMDAIFGNIFNTAEEITKDLFRMIDDLPIFGSEPPPSSSSPPSSSKSYGIPIEDHVEKDNKGNNSSGSGGFDLSGLARDV